MIDWVEILKLAKSGELPRSLDKAEALLQNISKSIKDARKVADKADEAVAEGLKVLAGFKTTLKSVGDLMPFISNIQGILKTRK